MIGPVSQEYHPRPLRARYWDVIQATLTPMLTPIRNKVLIKRLPRVTKRGLIHLPSGLEHYTQLAIVLAVGPGFATETGWVTPAVKPGDVVVYHIGGLVVDIDAAHLEGYEGDPQDFAIVDDQDIHCTYQVGA